MIDCSKLPLILVMKVTNDCNLNCRYCYHGTIKTRRKSMSLDIIKDVLKSIPTTKHNVKIIWHGGEPLLQGLSFYNEILKIENQYSLDIQNCIQTNGTLLDDKAIDFFTQNNFKIGISFDGPYNDLWRGGSTKTLTAINNLKKRDIRHGLISVMPSESLQDIDFLYSYYKSLCEDKITLSINTVDVAGNAISNQLYTNNVEEYYNKMSLLYEKWIYDKDSMFNISSFVNYFRSVCYENNTLCSNSSCLFKVLSINPDGFVFPCGKPYPDEYCLGKINSNSNLDDYFTTDVYENIVRAAIERRSKCKQSCIFFKYCEGGCNYDALNFGSITNNNFFECQLYQKMISQTISVLQNKEKYDEMNAEIKKIISTSSKQNLCKFDEL